MYRHLIAPNILSYIKSCRMGFLASNLTLQIPTIKMPTPNVIDANLFPVPSRRNQPNRELAHPTLNLGVSLASTTTLQRLLTDNYKRWHIFFNFKGFHNHNAHALLSLWSLGADAAILESSYEENVKIQRPAFISPEPITRQNWKDHLGNENFYSAYLIFFQEELKEKSFGALFEEYVFGAGANVDASTGKHPAMLDRFLAGLLHPMIHAGFGVEFSLPGTFAEGLAQAAVHAAESGDLIPSRWFTPPATDLASKFAGSVRISENKGSPDVHAFTILSRILEDPALSGFKAPGFQEPFYPAVIQQFGTTLIKYVDQWTLDGDLEKKVQELIWTNTLLYAIPGLEPSGQFNADFFIMHHVTSSLFLSEVFAELKRSSQIELLRSYFATCLAWYVGRGRPQFNIAAFFANPDLARPTPPGPQPTPHEGVHPSPSAPEAITPNNWLPIIQSTLTHNDDHLPKLQRSLIEYSIRFGLTPAGTFKDTELKDAGLIDGTLFIRAAGLTLNKLGWVREGQAPGAWDFRGFFPRST